MKYLNMLAYIGTLLLLLALPINEPLLKLVSTLSVEEFIKGFIHGVGTIGYIVYLLIVLPTFHLCMRHLMQEDKQATWTISNLTLKENLYKYSNSIKQ